MAVVAPPQNTLVTRLATDVACLDDLLAGRSLAMVTASLSDADLTVRGGVRSLGSPALTEQRSVLARSGATDPARLLAEIDRTMLAMRTDGTLSDLSRRRFGGADLTDPPAS